MVKRAALLVVVGLVALAACGFPHPTLVIDSDAQTDAPTDGTPARDVIADSSKGITTFRFLASKNLALATNVDGAIVGTNIIATVPFGVDPSALVASFTTTGTLVTVESAPQVSGLTPNDFSHLETYVVTAADHSTQAYRVTVTVAPSSAKELSSLEIRGSDNAALAVDISTTNDGTTITGALPLGPNLAGLVARFTTTGTSVTIGAAPQTSPTVATDFTLPVDYTVHAADGTTRDYTVVLNQGFRPHVDVTATDGPASLAVGDINGDGKPDLVTANQGSNTVSVFLDLTTAGAATPAFAPRAAFTAGAQPSGVAIGDLNGDGMPDLAVANGSGKTVSILFNTTVVSSTTAQFATHVDLTAGSGVVGVAIADVNHDGKPDVIVVNSGEGTVSVFVNRTLAAATVPTFDARVSFATGSSPVWVVVADFNGDGKGDLATSNLGGGSHGVSILINRTPDGLAPDFVPAVDFTAGGLPIFIAAADLDGDGKPDLAVVNQNTNNVSVLINTTSANATAATFAPKVDEPTGIEPAALALADIDRDGDLDLVVANVGSSTLSVLRNTTASGGATAAFAPKLDLPTGAAPQLIAVTDLNLDGKPDLVDVSTNLGMISTLLAF